MADEKYLPIVVEQNGDPLAVGQATFRFGEADESAEGTTMFYIQGWVNAEYKDRLIGELKQMRLGRQ